MGDVPGFLPSQQGFHFDNAFEHMSDIDLDFGIVHVGLGDAAMGLCGGMVYAARDFFEAGRPIPEIAEPPSRDYPLFGYLLQRLFDSWDVPTGPTRYVMGMEGPEGTLVRETFSTEWPAIQASIDGGSLVCLGIIEVRTNDVTQIGNNHQVLVWGYETSGTLVTLKLYDPNHHDEDDVTISFDLSQPDAASPFARSTGEPTFSFFVTTYHRVAPPRGDLVHVDGWGDWMPMGSGGPNLTSDPVIVANADTRLEAFVAADDGAVWHRWEVAPGGLWAPWASLGGILTSNIVVDQNADGRLEIFGRGTDQALWHMWQTAPSNGWSDWASLGGIITTDPAIGRNADGRLEVFARGEDNALWHIWQTEPSNGWSGWAGMGGALAGAPSVGSNADGRLEVFARGPNNAVHHIWQTAPSNGWSAWEDIDTSVSSDISVISNHDGRLEYAVEGSDGDVLHRWQASPSSGPWMPIPPFLIGQGLDRPGGSNVVAPPVGARDAAGNVHVLVVGADGHLWDRRQEGPGVPDWTGWNDLLTPTSARFAGRPSTLVDSTGALVAVIRADDGSLSLISRR